MNPTNHMVGEHWIECSLCGFLYPKSHMRRQRSFWVCIDIPCFDEPNRQYYLDQQDLSKYNEVESPPIEIPEDPWPETAP